MKILHFSYITGNCSGVLNKLKNAAISSKKNGFNIDFMVLNNDLDYRDNNLIFVKNKFPIFKRKLLESFFKYWMIFSHIPFVKYDFVIFRYVLAPDFFSDLIIKKYRKKIIMEHHTNENKEIFLYNKGTIKKLLNIFFERYYGKKVVLNTKYSISVSDSVEEYQKNKNNKIISKVIGNGLDIQSIKYTGFKKFDGKKLKMIMVANNFSPWHGLDRILKSLIVYKDKVKIELNLVGNIPLKYNKIIDYINKKNRNIYINEFGKLYGKDLDDLFSDQNVALSSMGMYRLGLKDGSSLKVSEYISRGMPIINGNKDTNIDSDFKYNYFIGNSPEVINFKEVFKFLIKISKEKDVSNKIREYAENKIDYSVKHKELFYFLNQIKIYNFY